MSLLSRKVALPAVALLCLAACHQDAAPTTETRPAALQVEEAARGAELGRDLVNSRAALEALRQDPTVSGVDREDATLALSELYDAEGDRARALVIVEDFLSDNHLHDGDQSSERAQKRLRELVGLPEEKGRESQRGRAPTFAPVTRALAALFPREPGKTTKVQTLIIGGPREPAERLGTWNVGDAIESMVGESCSLCDRPSVSHRSSRHGSFVGLARDRELAKTAVVAVYFDREEDGVPAAYERYLALPLGEIQERLDRGEGVVAIKRRPGAAPLVLLAAPRRAQLAAVEEAFAAMKELPEQPVVVAVQPGLLADEIQSVVRGARKGLVGCYEALLATSPAAAGKITLDFAITPAGKVERAKVTGTPAVSDPAFLGCVSGATTGLVFPSTRATKATTVSYPLDLVP